MEVTYCVRVVIHVMSIGSFLRTTTNAYGDFYEFSTSTSKYTFVTTKLSWSYARDTCQGNGGHLVFVNTAQESQDLHDAGMALNIGCTQHWIGLVTVGPSHWEWLDETPLDFSPAGLQEGRDGECFMISLDDQSWAPKPCTAARCYICEQDVKGTAFPGGHVSTAETLSLGTREDGTVSPRSNQQVDTDPVSKSATPLADGTAPTSSSPAPTYWHRCIGFIHRAMGESLRVSLAVKTLKKTGSVLRCGSACLADEDCKCFAHFHNRSCWLFPETDVEGEIVLHDSAALYCTVDC